MKQKKNVSLLIGFAIPIFMIVLIAASIYLPSFFAPAPQFNFLYVAGDGYGWNFQFVVENGVLVKREVKYQRNTPKNARLFIRDVIKHADQEITFEDAQKLKLDSRQKSPDGYEVVYGRSGCGFFPLFCGESHYNAMYLKGHSTSKKLDLQPSIDGGYYSRGRFLGWIKKEER